MEWVYSTSPDPHRRQSAEAQEVPNVGYCTAASALIVSKHVRFRFSDMKGYKITFKSVSRQRLVSGIKTVKQTDRHKPNFTIYMT